MTTAELRAAIEALPKYVPSEYCARGHCGRHRDHPIHHKGRYRHEWLGTALRYRLWAESLPDVLEALDRWAAAQEPTGAIVGREDVAEAVEGWGTPTLDAAWAAAEAALPDGWWIHAIDAWSFDDMAYRAEAVTAGGHFWAGKSKREKEAGTRKYAPGPNMAAFGPTPAAALLALAERLRAKP